MSEAPKELNKPQEPVKSGREILKDVRAQKPTVDYSEDFTVTPGPTAPEPPKAAEPTPAPAATPKVDPKEQALKEAEARNRILEIEAQRAQAERDLLLRQQEALRTPTTPEPEVNIAELYETDPLQAVTIAVERAVKAEREKILGEIQVREQQENFEDQVRIRKENYAKNVKKVVDENPDLKDPNSRLSQLVADIEKNNPWLFTIEEGPLRTIEMAQNKLELEKLKSQPAAPATPEAIIEAEKRGQVTEAARQTSVSEASRVAGPSRGTPPPTGIQLTKEQEYAARKLRMTPEQYAAYLKNSPKYFRKEEAPRRARS